MFVAQTPLTFLCSDCKPHCASCGKKFTPLNDNIRICNECDDKINRGMCVSCGDVGFPHKLSDLGHCHDCLAEQERWDIIDGRSKDVRYCKRCSDPITDPKYNYCKDCSMDTDTCIHCSQETKSVTEFACITCKIKYMKNEKT